MSPIALVPQPPQIFDYYTSGPWVNNDTLIGVGVYGNAANQFLAPGYSPNRFSLATPRLVWTQNEGGTGVEKDWVYHRGVLAMRQAMGGVLHAWTGLGGLRFDVQTDRAGLANGYRNPSWRRVQWLTLNIAREAGILGPQSGFIFAGVNTLVGGSRIWPVAPGTAWVGGFGIVCDPVTDGWLWENYGGAFPAVATESVAIDVISDAEDFNTFDFVWIAATGTRPAAWELWVNGVLFLQRNWETGTVLQHLSPLVNGWKPVWLMGSNLAGGLAVFLADWEFRLGRFRPDGREVLE